MQSLNERSLLKPYSQAEAEAKNAKRGIWSLGVKYISPKGWHKMKGIAKVRLQSGSIRNAELHWYEAHGIGRRKMKIKRLLD